MSTVVVRSLPKVFRQAKSVPTKSELRLADASDMTNRLVRRLMSFVKRKASGLNHLNVSTRIASFGLTAVLVFSMVFSFEGGRATSESTSTAEIANALNEMFQAARYAVAAEESLERKYRLEPGHDVFIQHRASAAALAAAIQAVRTLGDIQDRSVADDILQAHKRYLIATSRMFAAVDRGDTSLANAIDHHGIDPVFLHIEGVVDARAKAHSNAAKLALEKLSSTQRQIIEITISLSVLGLLSLGVFLVVLLTYQQRLKASHEAELDKLAQAALIDNLTGIGNHRAYQEEFNREVSRAQRHAESLSMAVIDIDDFKVVNDRNGHVHGDEVLKRLATLLGSLRVEDRAYRVGGDEFAVFLPHTSLGEASEAMQRLRVEVQAKLFGTTVCIGLATLTGVECDAETLRAQADAAMYSGKRAGRNSVTVFDAAMGGMWLLSAKKIHSLRRLIADGSMQIVFQPIWDVATCRVLAYEALARPDPKYGFDGPQEAFDLAERTGRAHELDTLCREAALSSAGALPADALLFVNVSPQSLDHGRLDPLQFSKVVRAAGLTPERVVIEITERSITRVDAVIQAAKELQRHGFRLALDDTGAGNSGLEMLSRLSLEFVKIDREVMVKALHDKNARGVLAGIVAIAQATDAYVIAEGIESAEMLDFVFHASAGQIAHRRGIHAVQGYLLRRPSATFPRVDENNDIKSLLKEFAVDGRRALQA